MNRIDRRAFLGLAGRSGAAMMMAGLAPRMWPQERPPTIPTGAPPPNMLLVLADQWRSPQLPADKATNDAYLPNLARLQRGAVNFTQHFAAAAAAAPSQACLLTGLYAHQHFCLITGVSELQPGFPTFGEFLRQFGYATHWFGPWRLTGDDLPDEGLDAFGFAAHARQQAFAGAGIDADGAVAAQAATWLAAAARSDEPWCAVVSLADSHRVDAQLGALMAALDSAKAVKRNTVVIFTSVRGAALDTPQGEPASAAGALFHTPLVVRDFSGRLQAQPGDRSQFISQVDLSALLLTIAYGGNGWRTLDECAHLASRHDIFAMLRNPQAAGRTYVLHTCDEPGAPAQRAGQVAPWHLICLRTAMGQFNSRSFWREDSTAILSEGQKSACFACQSVGGRQEPAAHTTGAPMFAQLQRLLEEDALYAELRAPLPYHLTRAQVEARGEYLADLMDGERHGYN